jgi:hypothetical protein
MNLLLRWKFDNDLLNHLVLEKLLLVQDLASYSLSVSLTDLTLANVASLMFVPAHTSQHASSPWLYSFAALYLSGT